MSDVRVLPPRLHRRYGLGLGSLLPHRDLPVDQIKQGEVGLVIAGDADINVGEAHLICRIVLLNSRYRELVRPPSAQPKSLDA